MPFLSFSSLGLAARARHNVMRKTQCGPCAESQGAGSQSAESQGAGSQVAGCPGAGSQAHALGVQGLGVQGLRAQEV